MSEHPVLVELLGRRDRYVRYAERVCGGRGYGEDIVHNAYVRLERTILPSIRARRDTVRTPEHFLLMVLKQTWWRMNRSATSSLIGQPSFDELVEEGFDKLHWPDEHRADFDKVLRWCLANLKPRQTSILLLELQGHCDEEIAARLGYAWSTIRGLRRDMKKRIRAAFGVLEDLDPAPPL